MRNIPIYWKKKIFREKIPDFSCAHGRMCVYRRYAPEDGHLSKTNKTHSADLKGVCPGESWSHKSSLLWLVKGIFGHVEQIDVRRLPLTWF